MRQILVLIRGPGGHGPQGGGWQIGPHGPQGGGPQGVQTGPQGLIKGWAIFGSTTGAEGLQVGGQTGAQTGSGTQIGRHTEERIAVGHSGSQGRLGSLEQKQSMKKHQFKGALGIQFEKEKNIVNEISGSKFQPIKTKIFALFGWGCSQKSAMQQCCVSAL